MSMLQAKPSPRSVGVVTQQVCTAVLLYCFYDELMMHLLLWFMVTQHGCTAVLLR